MIKELVRNIIILLLNIKIGAVRMKDDATRINRILANPTRRTILELLRQNMEMSYVEIRQTLGSINTGRLNYHLRILGDLISKNPVTGKYILTEAGSAAINMNAPLSLNAKARVGRAKALYIVIVLMMPFTLYLSYPLINSWFYLVMVGTYAYSLLFTSYYVWKRATLENRLPGSERGRRFALMYIFTVIFFFADIYILIALTSYFPAMDNLPPYIRLLVAIIPSVTVGVLVGNFVYNRIKNSVWLSWPF